MKIFDFFKKGAAPVESEATNAEAVAETANTESETATEPTNTEAEATSAETAKTEAEPVAEQTKESVETNAKKALLDDPYEGKVKVHNLIILDESGSMHTIYAAALSGVNETLQTIRGAQTEHPEQKHFVTLVAFDTSHYNEIYSNTPAEKAQDITKEQYRPYGGTPLYDAMGTAINKLSSQVSKEDVVLVTILTDGYENASRQYTGAAIKSLVSEMRAQGWVFTYIGANQDVEAVAESMAINNRMAFDATDTGAREMFEKERTARNKFFNRIHPDSRNANLDEDYFNQ